MTYTLKEIVDDTTKEVVGFEINHDGCLVVHLSYHQLSVWTLIEKIFNVHVVMDNTKTTTHKEYGIVEVSKKH